MRRHTAFDKEDGCRFTTYAGNCVKWEICRYSEQSGMVIRIPAGTKQRIRFCMKKRDEMETERGCKVTAEEALAAMGLSPCCRSNNAGSDEQNGDGKH